MLLIFNWPIVGVPNILLNLINITLNINYVHTWFPMNLRKIVLNCVYLLKSDEKNLF